jgi:hypothetical protein
MKEFTRQLRAKGYLLKEAAPHFGVKLRAMSDIAANPKPIHWLALEGLPDIFQ